MRKKLFWTMIAVVVCAIAVYFVVFGRALGQSENHAAIMLSLPKALFSSEAVPVDETKYLAKDLDSFVNTMARDGFILADQLGSGYFFEKNGKRYISTSVRYSSYFLLFTYPQSN
jgi:hypothetical protein